MPAAATSAPSRETATAMIGVWPLSISPRSSPAGERKNTRPSAPPATISPSRATATALSGVGKRHDGRRAAAERPDAQRQVIARADQRLAVRREGDAVDVLLMAFEHTRLAAARQRPQPDGAIPGRRRQRRAVGRHREADDRRRCDLRAPAPASAAPGCQIAILPSSPPVTMRPSGASATAFTALSWKRSTCSAALRVSDQRIAERVEAAGDRVRAVGRDRERAHRAAVAAQLRVRRTREQQRNET